MVSVRGRDAGRGEHPPEPRRGLGDDRARAKAGALERGADASRPAAHDEDVGLERGRRAGVGGGYPEKKGAENEKGRLAHGASTRQPGQPWMSRLVNPRPRAKATASSYSARVTGRAISGKSKARKVGRYCDMTLT